MELADRLEAGGCEVFIEDQNRSRVAGRESGSVMSGKPDLIALHPDGRATVYDVKTGRELDSHDAQVKLYMYLLPRARGTRWHGRTFDGCVVHGDGSEIPIPATAIDDEFRGMVSNLMRRVVSDTPARRVPSPHECGYCVLTSEDCPERIESEVAWPVLRSVSVLTPTDPVRTQAGCTRQGADRSGPRRGHRSTENTA